MHLYRLLEEKDDHLKLRLYRRDEPLPHGHDATVLHEHLRVLELLARPHDHPRGPQEERLAPNVDGGTGDSVGALVGHLGEGTITGCYVVEGAVCGA